MCRPQQLFVTSCTIMVLLIKNARFQTIRQPRYGFKLCYVDCTCALLQVYVVCLDTTFCWKVTIRHYYFPMFIVCVLMYWHLENPSHGMFMDLLCFVMLTEP